MSGDTLLDGGSNRSWWEYADDQTLRQVVVELVHLALEYGIPWMEAYGGKTLLAPEWVKRRVMEQHQTLADGFQKTYGLNPADMRTVKAVEVLLLQLRTASSDEPWDILAGASAYCGEVISSFLGGDWSWDTEANTVCMAIGGGTRKLYPLDTLVAFWGKPLPKYSLQGVFDFYRRLALG